MTDRGYHSALIVGAGAGLSASLARAFAKAGMRVALAARSTDKLGPLAQETGAKIFQCDASQRAQVDKLFADLDAGPGAPDVVVYNASYRTRGPFIELDPAEVAKAIAVTAFGGFLVGQAAARRMLPRGHGAILFTGASASVKGYAQSAPFAMGKFAPRRAGCQPGLAARSRRHRRDLSRGAQPAAQRLDARGRTAAVGGKVLTSAQRPSIPVTTSQLTKACFGPAFTTPLSCK